MFAYLKKLFKKFIREKEDDKNFIKHQGKFLINFQCFVCSNYFFPEIHYEFEKFKKNLKKNDINLYADSYSFDYFINDIFGTENFEHILEKIYKTAYEYPEKKLMLTSSPFDVQVIE